MAGMEELKIKCMGSSLRMLYNRDKISLIICEEYAKFVVEEYIKKYGIKRLNEIKHIFANIASEMIIKNCLNAQTFDEWEENKHPEKQTVNLAVVELQAIATKNQIPLRG